MSKIVDGLREKQRQASSKGMLYLCATPIGNLQDITLRALQCLKEADFIAVENMTRSRVLLNHYNIRVPLISFRESNKEKKSREILKKLQQGARIVLISDAGMPVISDPGQYLVNLLIREKMPFTVVPGASAALTALLHSGYSGNKFVFWGFPSRKKGELRKELLSMAKEEKTIIIYESPQRLLKTLAEMQDILQGREIAVCRELTKKFESVQRGDAARLLAFFAEQPPRGEITLVVSPLSSPDNRKQKGDYGAEDLKASKEECKKKLLEARQKGEPPAKVIKELAGSSPLSRNELYKIWLQIKREHPPL